MGSTNCHLALLPPTHAFAKNRADPMTDISTCPIRRLYSHVD